MAALRNLDVLGTGLADTIELLDVVSGKTMTGSTTHVYADEGDDFVGGSTSTGNTDVCYGGAGADTAQLGIGYDKAKGGAGNDTINGNEDDDLICGETGIDSLCGDQGDYDYVFGGIEDDAAVQGDGGAYDHCEHSASETGCDYFDLTSCPW